MRVRVAEAGVRVPAPSFLNALRQRTRVAPPLVLGQEERDIALAAMRETGADLHHAR